MSRISRSTDGRRPGFTLVELLVAMALILFIMSIISVAFVDSTESFRLFRARAELSEKLRFITQTLRADLRANHFENNRRLSDPDFWEEGPPKAGYFRIEQATAGKKALDDPVTAGPAEKQVLMFTSFLQGQDYQGFHSIGVNNAAPEKGNFDQFKTWLVDRNGLNTANDSRLEIGNTFNSPNAEIAWFLGDPATGPVSVTPYEFSTTATSNKLVAPDIDPNLAVYKLYRRVWPMLPTEITQSTTIPPTLGLFTQSRLSQVPNGALVPMQRLNYISSQLDTNPNVDVPMRRGIGNYFANSSTIGAWRSPGFNTNAGSAEWAVVADNVLSFSIEIWPEGLSGFTDVRSAFGSSLPGGQAVFDTWCGRPMDAGRGVNADFESITGNNKPKWRDPTDSSCVPMTASMGNGLPKRLLAVRITIRLYDLNTKSTWQATVIEYL